MFVSVEQWKLFVPSLKMEKRSRFESFGVSGWSFVSCSRKSCVSSDEPPGIITVRRLIEKKGFQDFIEACPGVARARA